MHLKIVFIGLDEKILFNKGILENIEGAYKKRYYKINSNNVEALFFDYSYNKINDFITNGSIVVIDKAENLKAEEIKSIKNNKDIILVFGKIENKVFNFEKEFIFPYLIEKNKVEVYDIVLTIYNIFEYEYIKKQKHNVKGIIGFSDNENLQQNILVNVLNNFKLIEKCTEYNLNIFAKEELNVAELAYIEDPIKEYTYIDSSFEINQYIDEKYKEKVCYSIIGI